MGYGTTLMLILLCVTIGMYAMGEKNAISALTDNGLLSPNHSWIDLLIHDFLAPVLLVSVISAVVVGSSFGVIYAIPAAVAITLANLLFLPISSIFNPSYPTVIGYLIFGFLNILLIGAIVSFIRGSEF